MAVSGLKNGVPPPRPTRQPAAVFRRCGGQRARTGGPPHRPGDDDTGGVWMSWWLRTPAEVDKVHALAQTLGMTITKPPENEPWNVREFHLQHPDGHTFRVSAPIECE